MMNINEILKMWKEDCIIDSVDLDGASLDTPKLHSKYLELFTVARLQLKRNKVEVETMKKDKWLYYTGRLTKGEIDEKGWAYDPFNGSTKPMKKDLDYYINADSDVQRVTMKIEYQEELVNTLEEIMTHIRWRSSSIKNAIDYRKFQAGS